MRNILIFRNFSNFSQKWFLKGETLSLINASFNNAVSKSIYHLIPFIVVYFLPVGKDTDIFLFLYEIYIFLSWTLNQSFEYIFVSHLTKKSAQFPLSALVFSALRKTFVITIGLYLFYLGILYFILPFISGFPRDENFRILKWLIFLGFGFPFGIATAILIASLTIKRLFFPITFSVSGGLITFTLLFHFLRPLLGKEVFALSLVASEIIKFILLLFFTCSFGKEEGIKKMPMIDFKEDLKVWKEILFYFLSTVVGGFIPIVLNAYATHLSVGSLTVLSYSLRLFYVLAGFFNGVLSLLLVIWLEALKTGIKNAIKKIDQTLSFFFLVSLSVLLAVIFFKGLFLASVSTNKEMIPLFNKGISIVFCCFPFYVLYLVLIRVFIMIKQVSLITLFSFTKLIIVISILIGGVYVKINFHYLPFFAFTLCEGVIAIAAFLKYTDFKKEWSHVKTF